jgi:hypothetical protein
MNVPVDLHRDNPYFDRNIPVTISINSEESKVCNLTLRIIPGVKQVKQAGPQERITHFEVILLYNEFLFFYILYSFNLTITLTVG